MIEINELLILFVFTVALVLLFLILNKTIEKRKEKKRIEAYNNQLIDFHSSPSSYPQFQDAILIVARDLMVNAYIESGKPIYTKRGEERADFKKSVQKVVTQLNNECCSANAFCDDFREYVERDYSDVQAKHLQFIISSYHDMRGQIIREKRDSFLSTLGSITPDEFSEIRSQQKGDIVGVYIIHNETKDMYYVGQATRLFFRINQHFSGSGNGDIYADFKYGDDFSIKMIKLSDSGYDDLDKLEKDMIAHYHADTDGYNKTKGNG